MSTRDATPRRRRGHDRFGQLYEVTEPNGVKTRYDYDAGGRLKKVCQNATGAGTATCGQARHFTYDNRGFLLSEQHPEKGVTGNGVVSYSNYDARGHALRRIEGPSDGANDLTFTFDGAERLTGVSEILPGTQGQRPLKSFTYGTGTTAPDYSKERSRRRSGTTTCRRSAQRSKCSTPTPTAAVAAECRRPTPR